MHQNRSTPHGWKHPGIWPADSQGSQRIAEDLIGNCALLVATTLSRIERLMVQLQIGRYTAKKEHCPKKKGGGMNLGSQAIRDAAHPGIRTKYHIQHDIDTVYRH